MRPRLGTIGRLASLCVLAGCADWGVELTLVGSTPLFVSVSGPVEVPVGVVATVFATATRDGEPVEVPVELEPTNEAVLDVAPVAPAGDDTAPRWALIGVSPGATGIEAWVDGEHLILLDARVPEQ